jgi:hypothetical protein
MCGNQVDCPWRDWALLIYRTECIDGNNFQGENRPQCIGIKDAKRLEQEPEISFAWQQ